MPFLPFLLVGVLHLIGQLAQNETLIRATKPLVILSLAVALVWSVGGRLSAPVVGVLIALFFSWLGDVALMLDGSFWFLAGLAAFLLAHVAYLVLFLRHLGSGRLPRSALLYLVWFALLAVFLWPHLGAMLVPALIYSVAITAMAIAATRCGRLVSVGALLFLLSDSTLAVYRFVPHVTIWQGGFLIMLTYIAAQGLIVLGVVAFVGERGRLHREDDFSRPEGEIAGL